MRKVKVFSAEVNGVFTHVKAYNKKHALKGFRRFCDSITVEDIRVLDVVNSSQSVWDEC